jgi:hypothetical protein
MWHVGDTLAWIEQVYVANTYCTRVCMVYKGSEIKYWTSHLNTPYNEQPMARGGYQASRSAPGLSLWSSTVYTAIKAQQTCSTARHSPCTNTQCNGSMVLSLNILVNWVLSCFNGVTITEIQCLMNRRGIQYVSDFLDPMGAIVMTSSPFKIAHTTRICHRHRR